MLESKQNIVKYRNITELYLIMYWKCRLSYSFIKNRQQDVHFARMNEYTLKYWTRIIVVRHGWRMPQQLQ